MGFIRTIKSALLIGGLGAALLAPAAHAQTYVMKLAAPTIGDIIVEWMKDFKTGVEGRTGGKLKVELYPGSQLGSMPQSVDGVMLGTIEAAFVSSGFLVGVEPRYAVFDTVGIFDDLHQGQKIFRDPEFAKHLATYGASKGIQPLTTFVHSPIIIVSRKPIQTIADFKGLKIRTYATPMQMKPLQKLGASPIPMTLGDILPALQNGTIDGAINALSVVAAYKFYDTAKYATTLPTLYTIASAVVNKEWLASLPPDMQAIIYEEVRKADAAAADWGTDDLVHASKTWAANGGSEPALSDANRKAFIDAFNAATLPMIDADPKVKADYDLLVATAKKYPAAEKTQ